MGDPVAPYAVAPQGYRGAGAASGTQYQGSPQSQYTQPLPPLVPQQYQPASNTYQYQALPQPQYAQPLPPLAPQQYQPAPNTYQYQALPQPQYAQPLPPLAPQQYQPAPNTYQYQAPPQPQYAQPLPPLAPQQYQATPNTYYPPGPSQSSYAQPPPPPAPQQSQGTPNTYHPPGPSQPQYVQPLPLPPRPHTNYAYNNQYPQLAYPTNPLKEQLKAYGASVGFAPPIPTQSGPYPAHHAYPHAHLPSLNDPVNLAPWRIGPDNSTYQSEPINDITSLLSRTHLDNHPTATTALRRLNVPPPEDGIYRVIRDVLTQDLGTENNNEMIRPDHPCFDISRGYARRWGISAQAIDNHIRLACGYLKFPVMMLLNPSFDHEISSFDAMVRACNTLVWIQGVLREIGLTLDQVIILDICTLLGDKRIRTMNETDKNQAMHEAYDVTREMLHMIKPNIIVSCQCSTFGQKWGGGTHDIARKLCSSMSGARSGQVNKTDIQGHTIHVVQAYHPGGFLNHSHHDDPGGEHLKRLLLRIYRPCGWELKRKQVDALVASVNEFIDELGKIYGFAYGYLGFQSTDYTKANFSG